MKIKITILVTVLSLVVFISCNNSNERAISSVASETEKPNAEEVSNSYISLFEIPAKDISRAIKFYETLLDLKIERMDVEGMQMGILPYENQAVAAVIVKEEGNNPSADGVTIYLNVKEDYEVLLRRIEENGGKILLPRTAHADGSGYFTIFLDSEGNKMALNLKS